MGKKLNNRYKQNSRTHSTGQWKVRERERKPQPGSNNKRNMAGECQNENKRKENVMKNEGKKQEGLEKALSAYSWANCVKREKKRE